MFRYFLTIISLFLLLPKAVTAQVVINEVLPNPSGDDTGAEWVELYNLGDTPVSLAGCVLYLHESDINQKVEFGEDDFIEKFEVISWNDSWLNNSGDKVRLICLSFNDELPYGSVTGSMVDAPKEGISIGRNPDGTGNFYILSSVTLGEANSLPPTSTPTPTSSPTSTPKPTSTPTPKLTFTPTPTPTCVPTKTPTPAPTLTISEDEEPTPQVLGSMEDEKKEEDPPSDLKEERGQFPIAAGAFILAGLGLMGFPLVNYFRLRKGYNSKSEEV